MRQPQPLLHPPRQCADGSEARVADARYSNTVELVAAAAAGPQAWRQSQNSARTAAGRTAGLLMANGISARYPSHRKRGSIRM